MCGVACWLVCPQWSLGCTLFTMLTRQLPFPAAAQSWYYDRIRAGHHTAFFAAHTRTCSLTPSAMALLTRMLQWSPQERVSVEGVLADPWLTTFDVAR